MSQKENKIIGKVLRSGKIVNSNISAWD